MNYIDIRDKYDLLKSLRETIPEYKGLSGLKGLIKYKLSECKKDVDYEAKIYDLELYGKTEEKADTIFNCMSIFGIFVKLRLNDLGVDWGYNNIDNLLEELNIKKGKYPLFQLAEYYYDKIFAGYNTLESSFNRLAELHHCLANFMPVPKGFNSYPGNDGKGNYRKDNDFPDVYFNRAKKDFPDMYEWIKNNKDKYCLDFFENFNSSLKEVDINYNGDIWKKSDKYERLECIISNVIKCIQKRAVQIEKLKYKGTLGALFCEEPEQWGLRGDPYLWRELKYHLKQYSIECSLDEFIFKLKDEFEKITNHSFDTNKEILYIQKYSHGGMSSGCISINFWKKRALDILINKFNELKISS